MKQRIINISMWSRIVYIVALILITTIAVMGQDNPVPALANINPMSCEQRNPGFTLSVFGSNFIVSSVVQFYGKDLVTTFISASEIEAYVPQSCLVNTGSYEIVIINPAPGGGRSNVVSFSISKPVTQINSISPEFKYIGDSDQRLDIIGENFSANLVVKFGGSDRPTTYDNSTHLVASLYPEDLNESGNIPVTVFNSISGSESNEINLSIVYPHPSISRIDTSLEGVEDRRFALTISGSNFGIYSVAVINSVNYRTMFVDTQTLSVPLPTDLLTTGAVLNIAVINPLPGGGESNTMVFTIQCVIPKILKLSPSSRIVGTNGFLMKVTGQNFTKNTIAKFNGLSRQTTYLSVTEMFVNILTTDLKSVGVYSITLTDRISMDIEYNKATFTVFSSKTKTDNNEIVNRTNAIVPENNILAQNYPNPFNPNTVINFELPNRSTVTLKVYNSIGQAIETILDQEELSAGIQNYNFNSGSLSSGEYFYHITADDEAGQHYSSIKKMILIK
jgi:hypothetical protein